MGQHNDIQESIVSLLSHRQEGLTLLDIAGALGVHRHTIRKYVDLLVEEGIVTQRGVGQAKLCYLGEGFNPLGKTQNRPMVDGIRKRIRDGSKVAALFVPGLIARLPRFELPRRTAKFGLILVLVVFAAWYLWFQTAAYRQSIGVTYRVREDMVGNDLIIECDPDAEPRIEGLSPDRYEIGDRIVIYDYKDENFRLAFGKAPDVYDFGKSGNVGQSWW